MCEINDYHYDLNHQDSLTLRARVGHIRNQVPLQCSCVMNSTTSFYLKQEVDIPYELRLCYWDDRANAYLCYNWFDTPCEYTINDRCNEFTTTDHFVYIASRQYWNLNVNFAPSSVSDDIEATIKLSLNDINDCKDNYLNMFNVS